MVQKSEPGWYVPIVLLHNFHRLLYMFSLYGWLLPYYWTSVLYVFAFPSIWFSFFKVGNGECFLTAWENWMRKRYDGSENPYFLSGDDVLEDPTLPTYYRYMAIVWIINLYKLFALHGNRLKRDFNNIKQMIK